VKYIQFAGNSCVEVRERPIPELGPGDALVKIALSAICGSEMHSYEAGIDNDIVPMHNSGHEMIGLVAGLGDECRFSEGQRVGINVIVGCGTCYYCLQGDLVHCPDLRLAMDGHSEYVVVPESCLVPLPDDIDWDAAVLLCGDTLGTPYHALKRLGGVNAAETAAVFGVGPIGIGCLVWLKFFGLRTLVSEPSPYRRELAVSLGADLVLDPAAEDVVARIKSETGGGADVCLDCAPVAQTLNDALDAAKVYGRVGFIAEKRSATIKPSDQVIRKELSMAGAWYFTNAEFFEQVEFYRRGLSLDGIITHRFTLDEAPEAYRLFRAGETGKVVFTREGVT
jgi:2-desacetyl-2-hydroxyethyl bacteriochlorophyllide A dehydrogenase